MKNHLEIGTVIIPPYVLCRTDITANQKLLYGKIFGLSCNKGYCFAKNSWLGENLGLDSGTISNMVSDMANKNLLDVRIIRNEKKEVIRREIYPRHPSPPPHQTMDTSPSNNGYPSPLDNGDHIEGKDRGKKRDLNINAAKPQDMKDPLPEPLPQPNGEDEILPLKEEVDYVASRRTRTLPIPESDPPPQLEHRPDPIKSAGSRLMRDSSPGAKDGFLSLQELAYGIHVSKDQFFRHMVPLGQLNVLDRVEESRIRTLIAWWHDHHSDQFAPSCFSGFDLRKKFSQLEQFMIKSKNGGNGNGKKRKEASEEQSMDHLSTFRPGRDIEYDWTKKERKNGNVEG